MRRAALLLLLIASPALAQERHGVPPVVALELAPTEVRLLVMAADSILGSGSSDHISLEAFNQGIATGVYLYGTFRGALKSIGYGRDPGDRRYLWLSVQADSIDYMAMAYDVDLDLTPDFLLLRTVDWGERVERSTEFRAPSVRDTPFDITLQPACIEPHCDPATWTVHDRARADVPTFWFEAWRPLMGLAAMRGERWLGRPVAALPVGPAGRER